MWSALRGRRFMNLKFQRQFEIGHYIVDFCCEEVRLIIELDGDGHFDLSVQSSDAHRTQYLQDRGYTLTRIENEELLVNPEIVLDRIKRLVEALKKLPHP